MKWYKIVGWIMAVTWWIGAVIATGVLVFGEFHFTWLLGLVVGVIEAAALTMLVRKAK